MRTREGERGGGEQGAEGRREREGEMSGGREREGGGAEPPGPVAVAPTMRGQAPRRRLPRRRLPRRRLPRRRLPRHHLLCDLLVNVESNPLYENTLASTAKSLEQRGSPGSLAHLHDQVALLEQRFAYIHCGGARSGKRGGRRSEGASNGEGGRAGGGVGGVGAKRAWRRSPAANWGAPGGQVGGKAALTASNNPLTVYIQRQVFAGHWEIYMVDVEPYRL